MNDQPLWIRVARCHDIPVREGRMVRVRGLDLAIFNLGDRFLAVENRCPHKGGPLADGILSGTAVVCPLHGWKLSLETGLGMSRTSESSCVQTFPLRVENGVVLVEMKAGSHPDKGTSAVMLSICNPGSLVAASESTMPAD